jgi:protease-4
VDVEYERVGEYKSAVESYAETKMSDANREQTNALLDSIDAHFVARIAAARKRSEEQVRLAIDSAPSAPEAMLEHGLVDEVATFDAALAALGEAPEVELDVYAQVSPASVGFEPKATFAIVHGVGAVVVGEGEFSGGTPVMASDTVADALRDAAKNPEVKAIVLRVDSPGGSATASDAIWRELMLARDEKPLIVSMSDLAASGGYYIAMPGHAIVAQPSTLTGSIGIFGGKFITGGVYEKLGANIESTSIGRHAEMNSPARPYNADELKKVTEQLESFYTQFVGKVAAARGKSPAEINAIAEGRVWTGRQALQNGLVDALGGLDTAVHLAKEKAGIDADDRVQLIVYPAPKSFYEIVSALSGARQQASVAAWLAMNLSPTERDALRMLRSPATLFRRGELLALMPFAFLR